MPVEREKAPADSWGRYEKLVIAELERLGHITFTEEEGARIRAMLESHERRKWLGSAIVIWVKWIGGVLSALVAAKLLLTEVFKGLFE
jgi:hypothetical protein